MNMSISKARDLIVHFPHASTFIPDDVWSEFRVPLDQVQKKASASADIYTDEMARQALPHAKIIQAPVSRIFVDVEPDDDDSREEMAAVGRGVLYWHDHNQVKIREALLKRRRVELLARYYWPHWRELRVQAAGAILIDLHIFTAEPWIIERHAQGARPENDIGFTEGLRHPSWVSALSQHFHQQDYDVEHNTPYDGVIDAGANAAVMIEIRRDVFGQPNGADLKSKRFIDALRSMPVGV